MFSAALYTCARTFCAHCAQDRGCSAHPAFPAPSEFGEGERYLQTSGAMRREIANPYSIVIARLDRATQYSRDADDRTEKPRRTGSPAFAEDDSGGWSCAPSAVIARSD